MDVSSQMDVYYTKTKTKASPENTIGAQEPIWSAIDVIVQISV